MSIPAAYHICRRARRQDIRRSSALWADHRQLYDADVWNCLPALLEDLFTRELVSFAIVESVANRAPRMLGGISFVRADQVMEARKSSTTMPNFMMAAALRGNNPFLTPKEVAKENASGTLNLMNFLGNFNAIDLAQPELLNFYETSNEGFRFFHFGYSYSAMWSEVASPHHVEELKTQGMHIDRRLSLSEGGTATLMRITSRDAQANPYARFSGLFLPPKPLFGLSLGEQQLLEYALLESSDEESAKEMCLSADAIKKRWRSIYTKVEAAGLPIVTAVDSGAAKRRALLHYLRQHLEELRPYRR